MLKVRKLMRGLLLLFLCLWLDDCSQILSAQSVQVRSLDNNPLIGVEVWTNNYDFSGLTDTLGKLDISHWNKEGFLNFRFLGYQTRQFSFQDIEKIGNRVILIQRPYRTEEVVIYGRQSINKDELPAQITTISTKTLKSTNPQTAADALSQHGDVYVQKSQMGGGSPVIRGFEANRVLLVIDGVRMNNAIYRSGHLQNAITVDPAVLDRMDIIFGPNSLMYGSDALGGVVHFQTKHPEFSVDDNIHDQLNSYVKFNSANGERSVHMDFNLGTQNFAFLTSATYSVYNDLRSGNKRPDNYPEFGKRLIYQSRDQEGQNDIALINDDPNIQVGTAYDQLDILHKMSWILNNQSDIDVNVQFSASSDIPRYDNLSELRRGTLRYGEWSYGPQNRFLTSVMYNNFGKTKAYDRVKIIGAYQRIDEDRISRLWQSDLREVQQEDVGIVSLTFDFSKNLKAEFWKLDYGFDLQYNTIESSATGENIVSGELTSAVLSRYGSGHNTLTNTGSFINLIRKYRRLDWTLGLRYSRTDYSISYDERDPIEWPQFLIDGVNGSNDALTFSASAQLKLSERIRVNGIVSTAFRSPNIDDLSKIRVNGEEISFPNLDLQPEKSFNLELGIAGELGPNLSFESYTYVTRLRDAIVRQNFIAPDGSSTFLNQGEILNVVANQNVAEAIIYGSVSKINYRLTNYMSLNGSINWIRGDEIIENNENRPFSHIPPTYGQISLSYGKNDLNASIVYRFNGFKSIDRYGGSVDNPEFATPEGTLAWSTLNIYGTYDLTEVFSFTIGLENLFDLHYRSFASGVSAPGRGISFTLRSSF